ncbi:MAG: PBP1A family penicillin-binding protein [Gemmatimonadetes bacterium]|nr:PBP1A family penicillin-binding protein [Gemmatimonadota bacterium]
MRKFVRYSLIAIASLAGLSVAGVALSWWLVCRGDRCPSIAGLDKYRPRQTSKLFAADGRFVAELGLERRTLVPIEQIPKVLTAAFVITEDRRFYEHSGIDLVRVFGAGVANVLRGGYSQGFSTITMQLARNVFPEKLTREKTLLRKLREAKVARAIESRFSKDHILELYLNQINLGSGAYGVETASQRYFGKSVRELNLAEAATLAALPKAPSRYNPRRFPDRAIQRRNTVLELMRREGAISDADASLAKAYPLRLAHGGGRSSDVAPYYVEWVRQLLEAKFGERIYTEGMRVYTTLDLELQGAAERALERQLKAVEGGSAGAFPHRTYEALMTATSVAEEPPPGGVTPYLQGAFIVMDPRNGAVRALVGGRDYEDSKFNRATQATRQPGSTFKPIVYATAIQSGRPPSYILDDAPVELPQVAGDTWQPRNYDLKFEGPMGMRRALYQSRNMPAIRLGMELGEQSVVEMARRFGITTPIPEYPSIHIGSAEVVPLQMVAAYSTFANLGWRVAPISILRVEDAQGKELWKPEILREPVLAPEEAWLMVDMMKDVLRRGSAAGAMAAAGFRLPAGGKTGTTNDYTDVWFIGYTADLVAGVWMGFDKPQKIMPNAQGGRLAAPAWAQFMIEAYQRKPSPPDWPRPSSLVSKQVDELTGLLGNPGCPAEDAYFEWYIAGTEPLAECAPRGAGGRPAPIKDTRPQRKQPAAPPAAATRRP